MMGTSKRSYGVRVVRGPVVSIPPHPSAPSSPDDLVELVESRDDRRPLAVDLFCGAGGLSIGLSDAGYHVVMGVDNDPVALETYAGLHPGLALCRDMNSEAVIDEVTELLSGLDVELIAGGPPCQPFSRAGASKIRSLVQAGVRHAHDERRDLWRAFLEIVLGVHPRAVLLENVPDMAISSDSTIVRTLVSELEAGGYGVHTAILRSCDHGVPQLRQRFFLVALADDVAFDWPEASSAPTTVRHAIDDLPSVEGGWRPEAGADGFLPYKTPGESSEFVRRVRKGLHGADGCRIYDHITRPVRDDDRAIFESMDSTTRYDEIDASLRRYRADIFDDKYKRLDWNKPSRSITAHIARDGYWYIHPEQTRTLTVREAARLQTFPDRVRFAGPPSAAFRQIGNAVPPLLAERVAKSILHALHRPKLAQVSSTELSGSIAAWLEQKERLDLPWLAAPTVWAALQAQLLLGQARAEAVETAWPTLEKLDSPERTIESADQLRHIAELIGREARADRILDAADWYIQNPDALVSEAKLKDAPRVTARMSQIAVLTDRSMGPTPVVVTQGSLRVASRVFGLPQVTDRPGSDGRLAVTRLVGGSATSRADRSRSAMAGLLELAARICTSRDPQCARCPLSEQCDWYSRHAAQSKRIITMSDNV